MNASRVAAIVLRQIYLLRGSPQRVLPLSAAIIITLVTVELIRRRKLREEYSLLWFLASVVLMVFGIWPELLLWASVVTGVYYLTIMIVICFGFLSLMVLHLAMVVSRSADDSRKLAQRLALMERKLEELGDGEDAEK